MTQRTWIIIGAAVVIVLAIWLFMGSSEPEPATETAPAATEEPATGETAPAN